jgi:cell wall-associated NlpC family hydrolase
MPSPWWSSYIGVPFVPRGRTPAGVDCWGLVRLVYADQLGVELPSLADDYPDTRDGAVLGPLLHSHLEAWQPALPQPFAVALFTAHGGRCHVGVMIDPARMLHTAPGKDACIQPVTALAPMTLTGYFLPHDR